MQNCEQLLASPSPCLIPGEKVVFLFAHDLPSDKLVSIVRSFVVKHICYVPPSKQINLVCEAFQIDSK